MQGKKWFTTLNNYTPEEELLWTPQRLIDNGECSYAIVCKEVAPTTGTPHLHGFFIFRVNKRQGAVKRILGDRANLQLVRGSNQQVGRYIRKDGDFTEAGEPPEEEQGRRTDLEHFIDWADAFTEREGRPPESPDIAKQQPSAYVKWPRFTRLCKLRAKRSLFPVPEELKEWQDEVMQIFDDPADDRSVLFVVGERGGEGKTTMCNVIENKYPERTQVLSVTKRENLAYMVRESCDIFVFNVARGDMEFLSYKLLEELKDRRVTSGKYDSRMKVLQKKPYVIILSNEYPDMGKLTEDRYDIKVV